MVFITSSAFMTAKIAMELCLGFAIKLYCENGRVYYGDIPALFGFGPDIVEDGLTKEILSAGGEL